MALPTSIFFTKCRHFKSIGYFRNNYFFAYLSHIGKQKDRAACICWPFMQLIVSSASLTFQARTGPPEVKTLKHPTRRMTEQIAGLPLMFSHWPLPRGFADVCKRSVMVTFTRHRSYPPAMEDICLTSDTSRLT